MKEIKQNKTKNPLKKLFIKICRLMGYEIIDQNNFYIPTLDKNINETLSKASLKSISLPLGEVEITRKVKSLDIIIRSCSSINMLTQNKKIILFCALGMRSALSTKSLLDMGFKNIAHVKGGFDALKECGLETIVKEKR